MESKQKRSLTITVISSLLFTTIWVYTLAVGTVHGWNIFPLFFNEIINVTWFGQFNIDFMTYLLLSSLWVMWRSKFSPKGIIIGSIVIVGGMMVFSIFLLIESWRLKGNIYNLLVGDQVQSN